MKGALAFALVQLLTGMQFLAAQGHGAPTPLASVVAEAENNNTQIAAADHAWHAAAPQFAAQDPQLADAHLCQSDLSGADLRPASNFSGSDPNQPDRSNPRAEPCKTTLSSSQIAAQRESDSQRAQIEIVRSNIVERVKDIYLRLAYLYQMYILDDRGAGDLAALIQNELSRYSQGIGGQSDVLHAQLERTKLLRETTRHHEEVGGLQAELKGLLHRAPDSPDVIPDSLSSSKLKESSSMLLAQAEDRNPTLVADRAIIDAQAARLESVRGGEPESTPGFMLRHTDVDDPDNYLLVPNRQFSRVSRPNQEITEAAERLESSRAVASEDRLRRLAEVQKQYTVATSSEELMRECKEGLIPQSKALYESKLAAYQSDREGFGAVIEALLDQISFEDDLLQALLEHETALAHLEALTGEKLR